MVHHTIVQDIRFSVGEITCQMIKESNYEKGYIKKKRLNETITYIYMYKLLLQYNNSVLNSISLKFKQKQLLRKNKELIKIATYIISKYLYEDCNYKYDLAEKKLEIIFEISYRLYKEFIVDLTSSVMRNLEI